MIVVHGGAGDWLEGVADGTAACAMAARAGLAALEGGSALDAVVAAVKVLEDAPACNAGTGAVVTRDERLELDACVMDGATLRSGAVAALGAFEHPVEIARAVMEDGCYHLLVADGAAEFALARGFVKGEEERMILPERRAEARAQPAGTNAGNTVGAVALDAAGRLAAATSTGGLAGTHAGRVGDTPIVGAGTYANGAAAASCTGEGEAFARACAAFWAVEHSRDPPNETCERALARVRDSFGGIGGMILVDAQGRVGVAKTMALMPHAIARADADVAVDA